MDGTGERMSEVAALAPQRRHPPTAPAGGTPAASLRRLLPPALTVLALGVLVLVPRTVGTTWAAVAASLHRVSAPELLTLAGIWFAGLWAHSFVLTASLPGLTRRRALTLNLTGSAIANVLPLGGAAGVGLNFAMVRTWGFSRRTFAVFTAVSNLVDVAAKLTLGAFGVALVALVGTSGSRLPMVPAYLAVTLLGVLALLTGLALAPRVASAVGSALDRLLARARPVGRRHRSSPLARTLPDLSRAMGVTARGGWARMAGGMGAYLLLQGVLLWTCLHALGSTLPVPAVVAGLAVERLLTILPLTPGGAGIAEGGAVAVLVALGGDPVTVAAAVLLHRGFTFWLEIPVGGLTAAAWWLRRRVSRP